jgi:hypothetical protein
MLRLVQAIGAVIAQVAICPLEIVWALSMVHA